MNLRHALRKCISSPHLGYDDYGANVRGKIVLALDHEPGERDPESVHGIHVGGGGSQQVAADVGVDPDEDQAIRDGTYRLAAFERVVFEFARPGSVVVTTPNAEYNVRWQTLPAGRYRHRDHRFEWTRDQFEQWATAIAERFSYTVRFAPVGPVDEMVGSPTQMAIFKRDDTHD